MTSRRSVVLFAAALATGTGVVSPRAARAQNPDRGGFVTRLGNDTIAVERFSWSKDGLEGERVLRAPMTSLIRYKTRIGKDGTVTTFEAKYYSGDRLDGAPSWSSRVEFSPNQTLMDFDSRERGKRTSRSSTKPGAVPMLTHSYALYEQIVRQTRRTPDVRVPIELVYPGAQSLSFTWIQPQGKDSVAIAYFHDDPAHAHIDDKGRILGFEAMGTVLKVNVTRVPDLDAVALARDFASRDAAGHALGAISPRDTVRATVGGAELVVDYGRPSVRGREIFGALVPWDKVWRTGADAATQFSTSRDITLGTVQLKAGAYTLWTKPTQTGVWLIVNGETGQWGTAYDVRRDVARIPLTVRRLGQPVERFTIAVVPSSQGAELCLRWDLSEWAVPVAVR